MNSFELYCQEQKFPSIDENPLSDKRSICLFSARENLSNILSSSTIDNQSSILMNHSNGNINLNKNSKYPYIYEKCTTNPNNNINNDNFSINFSKKNLEYDININNLKKKLQSIKEINKNTQNNIQLIKIRINKLQNDERISFRELEKTKKMILKIKSNKKKQKYNSKKKLKLNLNSINNKTLSFNSKKSNPTIINTTYGTKSQIFSKMKSNIGKHNSFIININPRKKLNFYNDVLISPKMKYFIKKNGINNSYDIIPQNDINNTNEIKTSKFKKKLFLEKNNKNWKNTIKKNLMKKLKEDEEKKRKIEEEIQLIEKEQYDLWNNFNENMYNRSTESNTNTYNTNTITNDKKLKFNMNKGFEEEYEEYEEENEN